MRIRLRQEAHGSATLRPKTRVADPGWSCFGSGPAENPDADAILESESYYFIISLVDINRTVCPRSLDPISVVVY